MRSASSVDAVDARAVAGEDRRGEGAVLARHEALDVGRGGHADAEGELGEGARVRALGLDEGGARVADRRRCARTTRPGGSRSRRAPWAPKEATAAPGRGAEGRDAAGRARSQGRARSGPAPGSRRVRARGSPRGRGARAAGREAERSRPTMRPSTFAVISCGRSGAATARLRSAASSKPSPGRRSASRRPAARGPARSALARRGEAWRRGRRASTAPARTGPRSRRRCRAPSNTGDQRARCGRCPSTRPRSPPRALRRCGRPRPLFSRADVSRENLRPIMVAERLIPSCPLLPSPPPSPW